MSRRVPPTRADRLVADLLSRHPELEDLPESGPVDSMSDEAAMVFGACNARLPRPLDPQDPAVLTPAEVALWSRWRSCRHVYRFDRALSEALTATDAPGTMPTDALQMMPYPIVYIDVPLDVPMTGGSTARCKGYFAFLDTAPDAHDRPVRSLTLICAAPDVPRGSIAVHLDLTGGTLGAAVDDLVASDEAWAGAVRAHGQEAHVADGHGARVRAAVESALGHVLYVISATGDQEVRYVPSGRVKRAGRVSPSTVHEVGVRTGPALGAAKVRYVGVTRAADGPQRQSPRAHVRAAHWHHYWTGARSDPDARKLEVRWLAPTLVGGGDAQAQTIVHDAG